MARIRSKGTKPELIVRRLVHSLGFRYRLHRSDLPGKPDLVFPSRKAAIFVHGCFWHQHTDPACTDARLPKSRQEYWLPKLTRNVERDQQHVVALIADGWRVLTLWDCDLRDLGKVTTLISKFLGVKRHRDRSPKSIADGTRNMKS